MMLFVYQCLMALVQGIAPVLAKILPNQKARHFFKVRLQMPLPQLSPKHSKRYWFHCASLGEFEQIVPVIEALKKAQASNSIVITFFSESGYKYRHQYPLADAVFYLPIDTKQRMQQWVKQIDADVFVLVKYELWYNLLKALEQHKTPVLMVSAVFRPNQFLFGPLGGFLLKRLKSFQQILVQDQSSYDCLLQHSIDKVILAGDTRYDRVFAGMKRAEVNTNIQSFVGQKPCLILGSSWPKEEAILQASMDELIQNNWVCIIAPHDVSEAHIKALQVQFQHHQPVLYSDLTSAQSSKVLIINTIGHLANAYQYADLAFIGGGFDNQLHNILEPLAFGVPTVFGPNCPKYKEAAMAIKAQVAMPVNDANQIKQLLIEQSFTKREASLQEACKAFVHQRTGATALVMQEL